MNLLKDWFSVIHWLVTFYWKCNELTKFDLFVHSSCVEAFFLDFKPWSYFVSLVIDFKMRLDTKVDMKKIGSMNLFWAMFSAYLFSFDHLIMYKTTCCNYCLLLLSINLTIIFSINCLCEWKKPITISQSQGDVYKLLLLSETQKIFSL